MSARPGLCGGHWVTGVPTAIANLEAGFRKNFLKPRLMHSGTTVVIPLYDCVIFVSALNGTEFLCWCSEITQTLDAITGSQFWVGSRRPRQPWPLGAICVGSCSRV